MAKSVILSLHVLLIMMSYTIHHLCFYFIYILHYFISLFPFCKLHQEAMGHIPSVKKSIFIYSYTYDKDYISIYCHSAGKRSPIICIISASNVHRSVSKDAKWYAMKKYRMLIMIRSSDEDCRFLTASFELTSKCMIGGWWVTGWSIMRRKAV